MKTLKIILKSILLPLIIQSYESLGQINIQNDNKGGVLISPQGILANFPDSKLNDTTNLAIGENALLNNPAGSKRHIAIGKNALRSYSYIPDILPDPDFSSQIAIGYGALSKHNPAIDGANIAIGTKAMGNVSYHSGGNNISIGLLNMQNALPRNVISIGHKTLTGLLNNQNGETNETSQSIYIGNEIGLVKADGDRNTVIGNGSFRSVAGSNNTILGFEAGYNLGSVENSNGNVLLGSFAGRSETGSDKLYIEHADITHPLIGGDFSKDRVGINRQITDINNTARTFQVEGSTLITDTLQLTKGAGLGKILTSDAAGNGSWQNIPTGNWQQNGAYISNTNPNGFWSPYSSALPVAADDSSNPPASPTSGNGTRMAWIPSRSAFQGGTFNLPDGSTRFISESIGLFSFCYGLNAESRSRGGVAIGMDVIADGTSNTLAFGENVRVLGLKNIALGFGNEIQDGSSNTIAMGESITNTGGEYVNSLGWGLQTAGYGTNFLGTFNALPTGSVNSWENTDPLFVIGNGKSNTERSNALLIQKNGVTNIGISPITSTTYRLRVGGSIYANSTIQGTVLRSTNLAGTGERHVCTDPSGNLIPCATTAITNFYNVSAMGFQPLINDLSAANSFQRDVIKCLVSFANSTKAAFASMYAPVELPQGFEVNKVLFNFLQNSGGTMTLKFLSVPKQSSSAASTLVSITSFSGAGVLEKANNPASPVIIDNENNYYYLSLEAGANWQGSNMALRGVVFTNSK